MTYAAAILVIGLVSWIAYELVTAPDDPNDIFDKEHEECVKARQRSSS